jgi:hypothetical protein
MMASRYHKKPPLPSNPAYRPGHVLEYNKTVWYKPYLKDGISVYLASAIKPRNFLWRPARSFTPGATLMKKILGNLLIAALLILLTALPALAEGGQVRGDNAQGAANQVQVQDPPPFQP